jgi:hypothetical protein
MHRAIVWSLSYLPILLSAFVGTTTQGIAQYADKLAESAHSLWDHSGSVVYLVSNGSRAILIGPTAFAQDEVLLFAPANLR